MDAAKMRDLARALRDVKNIEEQLRQASTVTESKDLQKELRAAQRQIATFQKRVLTTYDGDYITCRDLGHTWNVSERSVDDTGVDRVLTCMRCGTTRTESFTRYGDITNRFYNHPDEYLLPLAVRDGERFTKAYWRGIQHMRAVAESAS